MRDRIKKIIVIILAIAMVSQLPGVETLVVLAAPLSDGTDLTVSTDTSEDYIFSSGGTNSLTIGDSISVSGTITDSGHESAKNTVTNNGSINQYIVNGSATTTVNNSGTIQGLSIEGGGTVSVTGGEITTVNVGAGAGTVTINGCTIGTILAETSVTFEGSNTAAIASLAGTDGTGSLYVTDDLTINGEYVAMDIATLSVDRDTAIFSDKAISVMCEGKSYSISAGFDSTILEEYGMALAIAIEDASVMASSENNSDKVYWFDETSDTFVFNAAEGYYFEEDYADGITSDGNGTINATLVDDTTLNLTYTFATDDEGEVMINLPAATFIPIDGVGEFEVPNSKYGEDYSYTLSSDSNEVDEAVVEYKVAGTDDATYTTTKPITPGNYTARAILPGDVMYKELILQDDFSISKINGSATFGINDIYYGGTIVTEVNSDTHNVATAQIEYKVAGADDSTYTTVKPILAGNYTARVVLPENEIYFSVTMTDDFSILSKLDGIGTFGIDNVYYGETVSPQITSSTHSTNNATVEYKVSGTDDSTYTSVVPTATGDYIARVILYENEKYNELVMTDEFSIFKLLGSGVLNANDSYYGGAFTIQLTSDTNDITSAVFEYKVAGASDDTYTTAKPVVVGNYTVRVTLPANDAYGQVVLTDDFRISFLPAPSSPYSISGTTGDNGYYITPVTITPAKGYLVSDKLDGNYTNSLIIDSSMTEGGFYLLNTATGEKTAGIFTGAFYIDIELPFIDAIDDNVYYAEYVEISVKDENLSKITVNGEEVVNISNGTAVLKLNSEGGLKQYKIEVIDKAGNLKEITVVVAAAWAKSGVVPAGKSINLLKDYRYKLGEGQWQLDGDSTNYNGNITFYIKEEGEYTFVKQ